MVKTKINLPKKSQFRLKILHFIKISHTVLEIKHADGWIDITSLLWISFNAICTKNS
jgi:hypothetical protein